ncbi:MAG: hypothetical protein ABW217_05300 [Polyangiaceae bacterium]
MPATSTEGGQTGSGGLPAALSCQTTSEADCQQVFRQVFPPLFAGPSVIRAECVPASSVEPAFSDDSPLCRCIFQTPPSPYADTPQAYSEGSFMLGLARRRMLLGEPGDTCERRLDYWGAPGQCLLETKDFAGCSLDDSNQGCLGVCQLVTQRNRQIGEDVTSNLEFLGAKRTCCDEREYQATECVGAFRVNDQCGVGTTWTAGWPIPLHRMQEVSCDQSLDEMLDDAAVQAGAGGRSLQCAIGADAGDVGSEPAADAGTVARDAAQSDGDDAGR